MFVVSSGGVLVNHTTDTKVEACESLEGRKEFKEIAAVDALSKYELCF